MSYTVLARKYRPQTFADLVGQEHVTRTLGNAITQGRVAHAFLFTGVRGVGKTTSARILAKALNCEKGPTPEPCNACDACKEITEGRDLDVLEIDGASNNSVDDVRRLQETLPFRPARDRFKVVIVDEVHMLSTGAFNAFLKTLEEPPPHVKFIFATTEVHKVPVTIRSRCQRYDFRLIPQRLVAERVRHILAAEKITADDAAVALVAREAQGSMRDALTLLDQCVAFGGDSLHGAEVARSLGLADRALVREVVASVLAGEAVQVLTGVGRVAAAGMDFMHFARQLLELVRDLAVLRAGVDEALADLVEEERRDVATLAEGHDTLEIQRVFAGISKLIEELAKATSPKLVLEMGLLRLATRPKLEDVGTLLARLDRLEGRGGGGGPAPRSSGAPSAPTGGGSPPRARSASASAPAAASASAPAAASAPASAPAPVPAAPASSSPSPPAPLAAPPPRPPEPAAPPMPPAALPQAGASPPPEWQRIVALLRESRPALGAVLQHGVPELVSPARLVVAFPKGSFFGAQAREPDARAALVEAAATVLGARPEIDIRHEDGKPPAGASVAQVEAARDQARREEMRKRALANPRVQDAIALFPESAEKLEVRVDD